MDTRIAVLTSHSLFADGLISRLHEFSEQIELRVFDLTQPGFMEQIAAFQPVSIILEDNKNSQSETCSLNNILEAFPNVTVVYLHLGEAEIQVIQSEQYLAKGVRELVDILQPSKNQPHRYMPKSRAALPSHQPAG